MRIWNGTVVRETRGSNPATGVVISQTPRPDMVIVRWEGGLAGEWTESIYGLEVIERAPEVDGTRAYTSTATS